MSRLHRFAFSSVVVALAAWGTLALAGVVRAPWAGGGAADRPSADLPPPSASVPTLRGRGGEGSRTDDWAPADDAESAPAIQGPDPAGDSAAGEVRGRVANGVAGKAVPGARIRIRRNLDDDLDGLLEEEDWFGSRWATAGRDGEFVLRGLAPGAWEIAAWDPLGGPPARGQVRVVAGAPVDMGVLRIEEAAVLRGRVLGWDGAPRPGVDVWASEGRAFCFSKQSYPGVGVGVPPDALAHSVTDANGEWVLDALPAGDLAVAARTADGHVALLAPVRAEYARARSGVDLRLAECHRVRGTVRNADGSPAIGALVQASPTGGDVPLHLQTTAVADGTGEFEIAVPGASFLVAVDAARRAVAWRELEEGAVEEPVVLSLPARGRLTVRIVDAERGGPIAGARALAFSCPSPWVSEAGIAWLYLLLTGEFPGILKATAGPEGRILFDDAPSGEVAVQVVAPGYFSKTKAVVVPAEGTVDVGVVSLSKGVVVSGVVVDEAGRPLPRVCVWGSRERDPAQPEETPRDDGWDEDDAAADAYSDAAGRFTTPPLAAGRYLIRTCAESWMEPMEELHVEVGSAAPPFLRVVLQPAAKIRVTVVDARGRPADGAKIFAIDPQGGAWPERTDADGRADCPAMGAGRWRIARNAARPDDGVSVETDGRSVVDATLRLPPLATVRARIRVGGKPDPCVSSVRLVGTGATVGEWEARIDATGLCVFSHVEPGTYEFLAPYEGMSPVEVPVPDATDRDVEVSFPEPTPATPAGGASGG